MSTLRILCIGDVVGATGCAAFQRNIDRVREQYQADAVIVNGENSGPRGRGITSRIARFFRHNGADMITTGNHIWAEKEIYEYLDQHDDVLRPVNYPSACPGSGIGIFSVGSHVVGVINVQGRIFMKDALSCPFAAVESALTFLKSRTSIIVVDFHAETTSEKAGMGYFLDGKVSAVFGTHTHVQTADERILPNGTAFITDLGMVGSLNSMLGMKKEPIIKHMMTQMPTRFCVEETNPVILCGVCIEVDPSSGMAISIERVRIIDDEAIQEQGSEA